MLGLVKYCFILVNQILCVLPLNVFLLLLALSCTLLSKTRLVSFHCALFAFPTQNLIFGFQLGHHYMGSMHFCLQISSR